MKKLLTMLVCCLALLSLAAPALASEAAPTNQEIVAAYKQANTVYGWFDLHTLPTNGRTKQEQGFMIYYNVNYPGIRTLADLRRECNKVFTEGLTNQLISTTRSYKEFKGGLYVLPVDRRNDVHAGATTMVIIRDTATPEKITLRTKTEKLEDPTLGKNKIVEYVSQDYIYLKTPTGWRFANFKAVR